MNKEIYTIEEAAVYLGVKRLFITKMLKGGKLKGSKLGRIWRIQKSDIMQYLELNKQEREGINDE